MKRPPTDRERLAARLTMAAHAGLRAYRPTEIRGFTRYPCPGDGMTAEPCACGRPHTYYLTNHAR